MPFYFIKKIATLQVQAIKKSIYKRVYIKASLTIEVAMSLSIFLMVCTSLAYIFDMLDTHRRLQARIDKINMDACMYAYYIYNKESSDLDKLNKKLEIPSEATIISLVALEVFKENKKIVIDSIKCNFLEDKENISISLSYKYKLPFLLFSNRGIYQQVFSKRRAYIGKVSRIKKKDTQFNKDDEWVYIGKTSTKYHISPTCHYLSNNLSSVSIKEIKSKRNKNGFKYRPCDRCINAENKVFTVFIMSSGLKYHSNKNCSAILSYIEKVKKSEVEYMGVCSYCGGR